MFEKPQNSRAAGRSAAGGVEGSVNAASGSGSVAASGAAGAAGGEPETILVVDEDGVDGGDATQDEDATESENEASTDTEHVSSTAYSVDPALENLKELAAMAFLQANKKKWHVWADSEKRKVLQGCTAPAPAW
eukprot:929652-Rhodomonas_salina.1